MDSFEKGRFEYSPDNDPETSRLEAEQISKHELDDIDLRPEQEVLRDNERTGQQMEEDVLPDISAKVINIAIPEYIWPETENPFAFDAHEPRDLTGVARQIDAVIARLCSGQDILVRMIQSQKQPINRARVVKEILRAGSDNALYEADDGQDYDFHAASYQPFNSQTSTIEILDGFHKFKPKCETRPHLPVDIVMLFDAAAYQPIEYLHPRHNVMVSDRYRLRPNYSRPDALLAVILIN